jgi:hypothetical protein
MTEANLSVDTEDLDLIERRVVEMEKYLGIEDMDLDFFYN